MTTELNHSASPGEAVRSERLTTLDPRADHLTVINTYSVAPERAHELLDLLVRATEQTLRDVPGFVSANFHVNLNATQIVNYAQWTSAEALAAAPDFPGVRDHIAEAGAVADSFAPLQYKLRVSLFARG